MACTKRDLAARNADSLHLDPRGGSDYIELLILLGTVAFAALIGITLFGNSVSKLFDKEADHVATMTAWVPGTQPTPGSGTPLSSAAPASGQSAAPGGGASSGGGAANGSSSISGGSKASLPVVIANSNTAANGSQTPGAQPLVNNATTKASGARPLFTARSGSAGSVVLPPANTPTLGEAAAALAEAIGKHPVAAVVVPVVTNPAADGTLDGNPGATPYPNNVPQQQAPFPSDYPSSSAPAPTAEEVNSIPPSTAQEPSTDSTPPFPADDPTSDSTPPFPQAEETGNTTPPSPGAEPGIDPADPNAPVGNSNSDGTPTEGAIPITPAAPEGDEEPPKKKPNVRPKDPCSVDPSACEDEVETCDPDTDPDSCALIFEEGFPDDPADTTDDPDTPTDTTNPGVPCDAATDPDSCGATFDEGFPDDPAADNTDTNTADTGEETPTDTSAETVACDPDTDPDSCGLTADEGFPDETAEESDADANTCFGLDCEVVSSIGSIAIQAALGNNEAAVIGTVALVVATNTDLPVNATVQAAIFYVNLLADGITEDDLPGLIAGPLGAQIDSILDNGLDAEDIPAIIGIFSSGYGVIAQDIQNGNYLSAIFATAGYVVFGDWGAQLGSFIGSFIGSDEPSEDELAAARRAVGEKLRQALQQVREEAAKAARALVQAAADEGRCDELPELPEPPPTTECGKRFVQARDALAELGDCVFPTNPNHLSFLPANSEGPVQGGLWLDVPPAGESECSVKVPCVTQDQDDEASRQCQEFLDSGGVLCLARPPVCGPPDNRPDCETIALTDAMAQDSAVVADLKQRCSDTRIQNFRDGPYNDSAPFPTDPFGVWWDENFGEECRNEVIGDAAVYDGTHAIEFNSKGIYENPYASQYDRVNAHFTGTGKWSSFSVDPWGTIATAAIDGADISTDLNQLLKANATAAFQDAYVNALKEICGR